MTSRSLRVLIAAALTTTAVVGLASAAGAKPARNSRQDEATAAAACEAAGGTAAQAGVADGTVDACSDGTSVTVCELDPNGHPLGAVKNCSTLNGGPAKPVVRLLNRLMSKIDESLEPLPGGAVGPPITVAKVKGKTVRVSAGLSFHLGNPEGACKSIGGTWRGDSPTSASGDCVKKGGKGGYSCASPSSSTSVYNNCFAYRVVGGRPLIEALHDLQLAVAAEGGGSGASSGTGGGGTGSDGTLPTSTTSSTTTTTKPSTNTTKPGQIEPGVTSPPASSPDTTPPPVFS